MGRRSGCREGDKGRGRRGGCGGVKGEQLRRTAVGHVYTTCRPAVNNICKALVILSLCVNVVSILITFRPIQICLQGGGVTGIPT